jgi:hypothetical protein
LDLQFYPAWKSGGGRLKRLLKNSEKQIPSGLKSARDDKYKGLIGTTKQAAEKGTNVVISLIWSNEESMS